MTIEEALIERYVLTRRRTIYLLLRWRLEKIAYTQDYGR